LDLERGIFVRGSRVETDSGNNSLNTNRYSTTTAATVAAIDLATRILVASSEKMQSLISDINLDFLSVLRIGDPVLF
jgi:hypothetical protein